MSINIHCIWQYLLCLLTCTVNININIYYCIYQYLPCLSTSTVSINIYCIYPEGSRSWSGRRRPRPRCATKVELSSTPPITKSRAFSRNKSDRVAWGYPPSTLETYSSNCLLRKNFSLVTPENYDPILANVRAFVCT